MAWLRWSASLRLYNRNASGTSALALAEAKVWLVGFGVASRQGQRPNSGYLERPMSTPPASTPPVAVLAGPTASGKSALALELAERAPIEIVSADAMQVYRGMDIGTAKPTPAERARVPHHLIDILTPDRPFSVAAYVERAESAIADILARGKLPLVVGGTGFYIRSLTEGLATVPPADPAVQAPLWERLQQEGLEPLLAELARASPEDAARAERNPRRVVRALEILHRTNRPPSAFAMRPPRFAYAKVVLLPSVDELDARIEVRTQQMFAAGLVQEVEALVARYPELPTALQAIGYKEIVRHLQGELSRDEAMAQVTLATRQYARRQRTWFKREPGTMRVASRNEAFEALLEHLRR
jgi:tRNA dimethylallyltransferase